MISFVVLVKWCSQFFELQVSTVDTVVSTLVNELLQFLLTIMNLNFFDFLNFIKFSFYFSKKKINVPDKRS